MIQEPNRMMGFFLLSCFLLLFGRAGGAFSSQHVQAQLIAEVESIKPGSQFCVALVLTMEKEWHTYWKNPGDSGLPTTIEWDLPEGFSVGEIQWPYPQRFETSGIVSFGYADEIFLLMDIQAPAALKPGTVVPFSASVDWLACKEECVPEHADLAMEMPVKDHDAKVDLKWGEYFEMTRNNLPKIMKDWGVSALANGEKIAIRTLAHVSVFRSSMKIFFFPEEEGIIDYAESQTVEKLRNGFLIEMKRYKFSSDLPLRLKGILYSPQGWDVSGQLLALLIDVPLQTKK
jgi:DsbC/DsbD-like thiol-disulfide interchange protein